MQRRQFLILTGSLGGFSVAAFAHQALKQEPVNPSIDPSPKITISAAPKGLTAPQRGDVRIVVISDLNSQYGSTDYESEVDKSIALIPNWQPDLVLCGGDMVAGQKSTLTEAQINAMWDAFDGHIAAPLRRAKIPFGFTLGNHDASGALSGEKYLFGKDRKLAARYWTDPTHDTGLIFVDKADFPFNYSFSQKDIFYIVWDASTHLISQNQLKWAENSLKSANAQSAKIRIVIGHLPLYGIAIGRNHPGDYLADAEKLRAFLEGHRVHTYISGHAHAYYPGKRGQLQLLNTGALGSGPRQLLDSNLPPRKTLTVVDIHLLAQETMYTTYDMKSLAVIDIQSLPQFIMAPNGKVSRRDISSVS